jgi:hypothetical protein
MVTAPLSYSLFEFTYSFYMEEAIGTFEHKKQMLKYGNVNKPSSPLTYFVCIFSFP